MAKAAAGPRVVCRPYSFHLSAGLTNAELLHSTLGKPQGGFNLPEEEKKAEMRKFLHCKHPKIPFYLGNLEKSDAVICHQSFSSDFVSFQSAEEVQISLV